MSPFENVFEALAFAILGLGIFLLLGYLINKRNVRKWTEQKEAGEKEKEKRARVQKLRQEEDERRAAFLKQWFRENPMVLYYKRIGGITAVMPPAAYHDLVRRTEEARRNGTWAYQDVLLPSEWTFLFVTQEGRELFGRNSTWYHTAFTHVHWLTDLDALLLEFNLQLHPKQDIFVPYVSDTILPFSPHHHRHGLSADMQWRLVECHAPKDFWPLKRCPGALATID